MGVVNATPRPLYPRERPGTHCTGGWVGIRAGLDGCGKFLPHRDAISGPSNPSESLYRAIQAHPSTVYCSIAVSGFTGSDRGHSTSTFYMLQRIRHSDYAAGWMVWCSHTGRAKRLYYSKRHGTAVISWG